MPKKHSKNRFEKAKCPLCRALARPLGTYPGQIDARLYHYFSCPDCGLFFVANPNLKFNEVYNLEYYAGRHGDRSVSYLEELEHPEKNVRQYEYQGLLEAARYAMGCDNFRWLDYGCGNGGLIPYVKKRSLIDIEGYEMGAIANLARKKGIPILKKPKGLYDFISAVEVIEHHPDPLTMLREIRSYLKKGGRLLLTTGNARLQKKHLLKWSYAQAPDVHIRFFQPQTLRRAYLLAGLKPQDPGEYSGLISILRFKILKTLGIKRRHLALDLLPWGLLARMAEKRVGLSEIPWAVRV